MDGKGREVYPGMSDRDPVGRAGRRIGAQALGRLPERWRTVLRLTETEGMSPAQAAEVLAMPANAVAALAFRAREGLRRGIMQVHLERGAWDLDCDAAIRELCGFPRDPAGDAGRTAEHLAGCPECAALARYLDDARWPVAAPPDRVSWVRRLLHRPGRVSAPGAGGARRR